MVVDNTGNVVSRHDYFPFGLSWSNPMMQTGTNRYLYNGKELQQMASLDFLDYGARMYDAFALIWNGVDALAEKNPNISPYIYANNNPIVNIDPDGNEMTDYRNIRGELLYVTEDGLINIIVIPDVNLELFEEKLIEMHDEGIDNDAQANIENLYSLGTDINDLKNATTRERFTDNLKGDWDGGYLDGYNKKSFLRNLIYSFGTFADGYSELSGSDTGNITHAYQSGVRRGKSDRKTGEINKVIPQSSLKDNKPLIKIQ